MTRWQLLLCITLYAFNIPVGAYLGVTYNQFSWQLWFFVFLILYMDICFSLAIKEVLKTYDLYARAHTKTNAQLLQKNNAKAQQKSGYFRRLLPSLSYRWLFVPDRDYR